MTAKIIEGDCLAVLPTLADASVDAVISDPPYDLASGKGKGFMGKCWDGTQVAFRPETWAAVLKVLRPGGYLLAFGGTRTYHRMACAIEDAGFEIRDSIHWVYGSGFPKSLDISKSIDKAAGADRKVVGPDEYRRKRANIATDSPIMPSYSKPRATQAAAVITIPATEDAKQWSGWGTALKPAHEPIVVARKPLSEGTVAANVLEHGTGGLNVDQCRVPIVGPIDPVRGGYATPGNGHVGSGGVYEGGYAGIYDGAQQPHPDSPRHDVRGRFPPNLVMSHHPDCERIGVKRVKGSHDNGKAWPCNVGGGYRGGFAGTGEGRGYTAPDGTEAVDAWRCVAGCPVAEMDRQSGASRSPVKPVTRGKSPMFSGLGPEGLGVGYADSGGASRFFPTFAFDADDFAPFLYCAKASRRERNEGLDSDEIIEVEVISSPQGVSSWEGVGRKVRLRVDTGASPPRVTAVCSVPELDGSAWSTILFGSGTVDKSPRGSKSTIGTEISSTTSSRTLNWLMRRRTSGSTVDANCGMESGGNHVGNVGSSSPFLSITLGCPVSLPGVGNVASGTRLRISGNVAPAGNSHNTVKPLALMRWLCRLVTPPGGLVLDPFAGSGSTGVAALREGFRFLGIEQSPEYCAIARVRLDKAASDRPLLAPA